MLFCDDSKKYLKEQNINLKNEFDKDDKRVEKFSLKHQNIYLIIQKILLIIIF